MDHNIEKLVWIDLEMTGLDYLRDKILQIAILITDTDLNLVEEKGYVGYVKPSRKELNAMSDEVRAILVPSGVLENAEKQGKSIELIEQEALKYVSTYVPEKSSPLCGNTIATDRTFLTLQMPRLNGYLHYRNIDVTAIKQVFKIWGIGKEFSKKEVHEAMEDIKESIDELRYYRGVVSEKS